MAAGIDRLDVFTEYLLGETIRSFGGGIGLRAGAPSLLAMRGGALAGFLKGAKVKAEVAKGIARALSFVRGESSNASEAVSDALMLPDRLAAQCGRRCVLIIDEFPSLAGLKAGGKRAVGGSIVQAAGTFSEEYRRTALAISASEPGAVGGAAASRPAPLYGQLSTVRIEPLGSGGVRKFASKYLPDVESSGGGIDGLLGASGGLPHNLQAIGRELGRIGQGKLDAGLAERAVAGVISREGRVHFDAYLAAMRPSEVRAARIMALRGAGAACRPLDMAPAAAGSGGLPMNKATALFSGMLAKGIVLREGAGRYRLADPLFGAWLAAE